MNYNIAIDNKMNEYGEFNNISDVLAFWGYTIIKPIISIVDYLFFKVFLSLMVLLIAENDPNNYAMILDMFKVPLDLVVLLSILWMADILTGLFRAKFVKKEVFIPAKVMMWFIRGIVYMIGLGLFTAFVNVAAKYFGDLFFQAQAFVFLVLAFTELWSNIRNLVGHNAKDAPLGKALISLFSGKGIGQTLKEIMEGDVTDQKNN